MTHKCSVCSFTPSASSTTSLTPLKTATAQYMDICDLCFNRGIIAASCLATRDDFQKLVDDKAYSPERSNGKKLVFPRRVD